MDRHPRKRPFGLALHLPVLIEHILSAYLRIFDGVQGRISGKLSGCHNFGDILQQPIVMGRNAVSKMVRLKKEAPAAAALKAHAEACKFFHSVSCALLSFVLSLSATSPNTRAEDVAKAATGASTVGTWSACENPFHIIKPAVIATQIRERPRLTPLLLDNFQKQGQGRDLFLIQRGICEHSLIGIWGGGCSRSCSSCTQLGSSAGLM